MKKSPWRATLVTLFPEMFPGPLAYSLAGKALEDGIWNLNTVAIRDFSLSKHNTVDDTCFGGGAGMVLRPDVVDRALDAATKENPEGRIIYLTPRGKPLIQEDVRELALHSPGMVILCGRYEGVDQRVLDDWQERRGLEEYSLGDYILSGGEIAAFALLDACIRLLPGVVGSEESLQDESFELELLEYPQYTRPQQWNDRMVPDVLLSGHHQKIQDWRREQAKRITRERRPDLWAKYINKHGN